MKVFLKKNSATTGTKIIVVESKAARTNKVDSFYPSTKKDGFNLLLDKLPTVIKGGVEVLAL